jgi:ferrous iron transport protein B
MKCAALMGMPNTGKTTFFNRLTGARARVGNWPGITVELMQGKILLGTQIVAVVDLPGIYDLHGFSDDEQVVRHFLEHNPVDLVLLILNATQIERQLSLVLQVKDLGLPAVLLLNMADEAERLGIRIDTKRLARALHMPVVLLSAKYGKGFSEAKAQLDGALQMAQPVAPERLRPQFSTDSQIEERLGHVLHESVEFPVQFSDQLTARLDRVLLHPWLGPPLFLGILFLVFQAVYALGTPLQDGIAWMLDQFKAAVLAPLLVSLPASLEGFLLDGVYDGVGTVASFVPIIVLFFLFMALVEDSGYLSRSAFLIDALMSKLGLDGRSFVMMLMGFGCNVPALMGTRVMRARALRLLTMLVIPFSLCSARLQVFVFLSAALFSPYAAPWVLLSLYLASFLAAMLTALLFKGPFSSHEPFVLELPPYRFPTLQQIALRAWHEVRHFLRRASTFIVAGVVLVWLLTHLPADVPPASAQTWAGAIGQFLAPALQPLGIDQPLAVALIFGFVAKEIVIGALAVIYGQQGTALMGLMAHQIDWVQAYSFMLFTLLYTPCLSTVATLHGEAKSLGFTVLSIAWALGLAWLVSLAFYQGARLLGF